MDRKVQITFGELMHCNSRRLLLLATVFVLSEISFAALSTAQMERLDLPPIPEELSRSYFTCIAVYFSSERQMLDC